MKENPYFETRVIGLEVHTSNRFPDAVAIARVNCVETGAKAQVLYIGKAEAEAMEESVDRIPKVSVGRVDDLLKDEEWYMGLRVHRVNERQHLAVYPAFLQ